MRTLVMLAGMIVGNFAWTAGAAALDCKKLAEGKGGLKGQATMGAPDADKNPMQFTIARDEHVVVTMTNLAKAQTITSRLDGIILLETSVGTPPKTYLSSFDGFAGDMSSLETGTKSSYTQTIKIDGRDFRTEQVAQEIGVRGSKAISGCNIETVRVHRDIEEGGGNRRSLDFDFAPSVGYPVYSSGFFLRDGKTSVSVFEMTSLETE